MGRFTRKNVSQTVDDRPDETTMDRRKLLAEQNTKLRRAEQLKRRSAAVAADLNEEGKVNNYAWRLRQAARNSLAFEGGNH